MSKIYEVNTNNLAISEYDLDHHTLAVVDGSLYSIDDTNLYEHTGTDDDGTDIDCYITTGQKFFGTFNDKRAGHITINIAHSSKLVVDLVVPDLSSTEGNLTYYTCDAARQYAEGSSVNFALDFNPPRGVRASTLGVKVSNVDGGTFGVNDVAIRVTDTRLK